MRWIDTKPANERAQRIDREIDAEFAFHIAHLEDELTAQGLSEEQAREEARKRFGDEARLHCCCRDIALKELTMLKRMHVVVTVVLVLGLLFVGFVAMRASAQTSMAREATMAHQTMAEHERERADAVMAFLVAVLASADPATPNQIDVATVLREAEAKLDVTFEGNEALEAKLREAMDAARKAHEAEDHE